MCNKSILAQIAYWLTIIGALNLGLYGLGYFLKENWNLLYLIIGSTPTIPYALYVLIGLSAIYTVMSCQKTSCN